MTDIDKGGLIRFADGLRRREDRVEALYRRMNMNPALQLVRRVDALNKSTWDVDFREVRPGVKVAQIPGDRMMFIFLSEPEKPPPSPA